jgi:ABC-2 type transport system permease protein
MRYLRLLALFLKNSLLVEMEYRANFVLNTLLSVLWMGVRLVSVLAFFEHRDTIAGWTLPEMLIVIGLFNIFNGVIDTVLRPNVDQIVEHIRKGTMDFILTKPVNSQFLASLRHFVVWNLADVFLGLGVIVYALGRLDVTPTPAHIAIFVVLLLAGLVIVYAFWMLLITTAFWFVRVPNIAELFTTFFTAGRFPVTVYPSWIRVLLTFVVPIAFLTTFPAASLLGRLSATYALLSLGLAAGLLAASAGFWNYAVRHYASASS